jgi:hypothetical protein
MAADLTRHRCEARASRDVMYQMKQASLLQVAAATVLRADNFHTFDDRQKKLAKAAGLVCR